jgi:DNA-binding NarL/FixJ family response regulator
MLIGIVERTNKTPNHRLLVSRKRTSPDQRRKQLLILDDHPMMREGLAQLINNQTDLAVCAEAGTGREAVALAAASKPDLVLADISLPDTNGLEVIKNLHAIHPGLLVLVISMHDEAIYAERVLRAGARGYIMKQEGGKKLMEAIRRVLEGHIYVSEKISATMLEAFSGPRALKQGPIKDLSDREFEVLQLLGQGKGSREISRQLRLSIKTVDAHRANIKRKLHLRGSSELVRYAVRWVESES